ncbi:tripartite motif-containing protein 16-like [Lithobates pipiens]
MACADLQDWPRRCFNTVSVRGSTDTSQSSVEWTKESPVFCTYCIKSRVPAAKTCGTCEASLCQQHLEKHSRSSNHDLFEPTASLHTRKCPFHRRSLTHYCSKDSIILCHDCLVAADHKGHMVESLQEASEKKKEKLGNSLNKHRLRKDRTQNRIKSLQEKIIDTNRKGNAITSNISSLFTDLRGQLEALERQMVEEVSSQRQKVIDSIHEQIQNLEKKLKDLSEKILYMEELCKMTDSLAVMQAQKFGTSNTSLVQELLRRMSDEPNTKELDDVFLSMTLHNELIKIINKARQSFRIPEAYNMAFNADTAGDFVFILGDGKTACKSKLNQLRPETPEKFYCPQALSNQRFSAGQHAWEVEAGGNGDWMVGVAYPSIERKGHLSYLGINNKSWCLRKWNNKYSVKHNVVETLIDAEPTCHRFVIYLDYDAGQLSFYQLSNPVNHLHTFTAIFTEPLHAAFTVEDDAWVRIRS